MNAKTWLWTLLLMAPLALQAQDETGPGRFSFDKKSYNAVEGSHKKNVLKIMRTHGNAGKVTVTLSVTAGSAKPGEDFEDFSQTLTFDEGEHSKTVSLPITADNRLELAESFRVALQNPSGGATLGNITDTSVRIVMIGNDAVVLGILMSLLALVFTTASSSAPRLKKFYKYVPSLLLCYFLPSIFSTLGVISGDHSSLYYVASRYLLPTCLVLLCLSIDLKGIIGLGPKALIMFFTGTAGIVIGGPLAMFLVNLVSPETVSGQGVDAVWRGMTTVAGSWIGGGANQTAMKEVFDVGDQIFSATVTVDIIVASLWMAVLLFLAGTSDAVDAKLGADNSAIKELQAKMQSYQDNITSIPTLTDLMTFTGVAFAVTAIAHFLADFIAPLFVGNKIAEWFNLQSGFLWLIVFATLGGLGLSFTRAAKWEGVGASRVGSAFLYVLVASIGMKMDLMAIFQQPGLFVVGAIWILFHGILLFTVAKLIKAPLFFLAVGSQANVGGAASAPIVASAFHPTLATVGVMLAVFGYFVGTFAALVCGLILQAMFA